MFFLQTDGSNAVGKAFGGFGALGLDGYGVELDVFDSGPCDPGNGNHAGIDLLSGCGTNSGVPAPIVTSGDLFTGGTTGNIGDIGDGATRTATMMFVSGQMSVTITDSSANPIPVPNLQGVALPGFTAGTPYYFGFSGGSGSNGQASRIEIQNVSISFPSTRCL
jgi:hypothetical protein